MAGSSWTGKHALRAWLLGTTALLPAVGAAQAQSVLPNARPTGGQVVAGSASINQSSAATTTITQTTDRAAINWQSFNVGSQQAVQFRQPSATSWTLNRVTAADPSVIAGRITANGGVAIVNQSGVVFAEGAQVNVGSLIASAANITNQNFMNGRMVFDGAPNPGAKVENRGDVTIADRGLAALVGPRVANSGTIRARLGRVALAGAETYSLDLAGDGLLSIDVTQAVRSTPAGTTALVTNSGVIEAAGGSVLITAHAASGLVEDLVRNTGRISAPTEAGRTGTVALRAEGGGVRVEGTVAATGGAGQRGGSVTATATSTVTVAPGASVDASGGAGGGSIAIGGTRTRTARVQGSVTARGTGAGARGGRVAVQATETVAVTSGGVVDASGQGGGGDIRFGTTGFGRDQTMAATTTVEAGASLVADATVSGNGGTIAVNSSALTTVLGTLAARGGAQGGNGGTVEVSALAGINAPAVLSLVDVTAPAGRAGTLLLDPDTITIGAAGSAVGASVAAADAPTTLNITAASVSAFAGNLVLEAVQTITVNTAISKPTGDLTLRTTGATGTPGIFVNANITLGAAGAPPTGGALTLTSATGITVGGAITVFNGSATLTAATTLALNDSVTAAASSTFTGPTSISIQKAVDVGAANTLTLRSDGTVSSHATNGIITAGTLDVHGATGANAGAVTLNAANLISNLSVLSSGAVSVVAAQALTVTGVTANGTLALRTTSGLLTISGDISSGGNLIDLQGAGGITLDAHVNAGVGQVVLRTSDSFDSAGSGGIAENASGRITAGSVAASSSSSIYLTNAANAFSSLAAGRDRDGTAATRSISMPFGTGEIHAPNITVDAPIFSSSLAIYSTGTLGINASMSGANSVGYTLQATGTMTVAATITGDFVFLSAADMVISARVATPGGNIGIANINSSSGSGAAPTGLGDDQGANPAGLYLNPTELGLLGGSGAGGTTVAASRLIVTLIDGNLNLLGNVALRGRFGTLEINGTGASVVQSAGSLDVGRVAVNLSGSGTVNLAGGGATNRIDEVSAHAGGLTLSSTSGSAGMLTVVNDSSTGDGIRPNGVTGAVSLTAPAIAFNAPVTGTSVSLTATTGNITQTSAGVVTATSLSASAQTGVLLATANDATTGNLIGSLTASSLTGGVAVFSRGALTVAAGGVVSTTSGGIDLTGTSVTLDDVVTASGQTVNLTATTGSISQLATAEVTAGALNATATTGVALATASAGANLNAIGNLTASTDTGGVSVFSSTALTVAAGGISVTTSGGVNLEAPSIAFTGGVTASGQTLTLNATGGSITQGGSGAIVAQTLNANATTGIDLSTANNTTTGNLIAEVTGNPGAGAFSVFSRGSIAVIGGGIAAGGQTVTLATSAGSITQQAGATISAATLAASATTGVVLNTNINAGIASVSGGSTTGGFAFRSDTGLTVNTGGISVATSGGITLRAPSLTLTGAVGASGQTVSLTADSGGISQGASGTITANALRLSAAGAISLTAATANAFNLVSGSTTVGGIALRSAAATLTVDAALTAQTGNSIDITAPALTVNARIGFGAANAGNAIRLTTDSLTANGADTVDASTSGTVRIATQGGSTALAVGTAQLSDGSLEQVVAGRLILVAGGALSFTTSQDFTTRGVTALELVSGGSITQSGGTVLKAPSLTAIAGTGATDSIALTGQNVVATLAQGTEVTGFGLRAGGDVAFTMAAALLTVNSGAVIQAGTGKNVTLRANDLVLGAAIQAASGNLGAVALLPNTAGRAVTLGGTAAGTLSLDNAEIALVAAGTGTLRIGSDGSTTTAGIVTIAGDTTVRGHAAVLDLRGQQVVQTGGIVDVATLTGAVATVNSVAAAGFAVDRSSGGIPVNTVDAIGGITASAGGISLASANALAVTGAVNASGGTISIASAAALSVTADVTATATVAAEVNLTAGTTLDIGTGSAVLVRAAGGDVTLTAGDAFTLAANATVRAEDPALTLGNITVIGSTLSLRGTLDASTSSNGRSVSLTATDGRIVIAQNIDARQSVTLNASGTASATIAGTGAAIVVNSGVSITGGGFVTLNETTATGGGLVRDIDIAGTLRGTLGVAATTLTGTLRVAGTGVIDNSASAVLTAGLGITQAGSITAGSLVRLDAGTSGIGGIALTGNITASTGDVVVRARLGDIIQSAGTLTATSTAPRGTVALVAEAGNVTQSGTGAISATQLIARATGDVTLAGTSNAVGTLLGTGATGSLDSTAFPGGHPALLGSMAGGDFQLRSSAALLTVRGLVRAGTLVDSAGALDFETAGRLLRLLADDIALDATGSPSGMVLQAPLGQIELAPHTLGGATPRAIVLGGSTATHFGALTIDSTEIGLIDTRTAAGSTGGTVVIGRADAGAITLAGSVGLREAVGSFNEYDNVRARTLVLASGAGISQTAGPINVENLAVIAGGAVSLDQVNVVNAITGTTTTVTAAGTSGGFTASGISADGAVTLRVGGRDGTADASLAAGGTTPVLPPALDADGVPLGGVAALRIDGAISTNGAGDITIRADDLAVAAALNAGTGRRVTLQPTTAGQAVLLGGVVTGTVGNEPSAGSALSLTATELAFVSADLLRIGGTTAGRVVQGQQAIDLTGKAITLEVLSAYGFEQRGALLGGNAGANITVANFAATIDTAGRTSGADADAASIWLGADNHIARIGDTTGLATSGGAGIRLTIDRATVDGTLPTNAVTIREAAGQALLVADNGIVLNRSGGRVTLVADRLNPFTAAVSVSAGSIELAPRTAGLDLRLGTASVVADGDISAATLAQLDTGGGVLRIGRSIDAAVAGSGVYAPIGGGDATVAGSVGSDNTRMAGNIAVTGNLGLRSVAGTLELYAGVGGEATPSNITQASGTAIDVAALSGGSRGYTALTNSGNSIDQLAQRTVLGSADTGIAFRAGTGALADTDAVFALRTGSALLTVAGQVSVGVGAGAAGSGIIGVTGGAITLIANDLALGGTLLAPDGTVALLPHTAGRHVALGRSTPATGGNELALDAVELTSIRAGQLIIGQAVDTSSVALMGRLSDGTIISGAAQPVAGTIRLYGEDIDFITPGNTAGAASGVETVQGAARTLSLVAQTSIQQRGLSGAPGDETEGNGADSGVARGWLRVLNLTGSAGSFIWLGAENRIANLADSALTGGVAGITVGSGGTAGLFTLRQASAATTIADGLGSGLTDNGVNSVGTVLALGGLGSRITLVTDALHIPGGRISAPLGTIEILPATAGRGIVLGGSTVNTLSLSTAEIARIGDSTAHTGVLRFGRSTDTAVTGNTAWPFTALGGSETGAAVAGARTGGDITLAGDVVLRTPGDVNRVQRLELFGDTISQAAGTLNVADLAGDSRFAATLTSGTNRVDQLVARTPILTGEGNIAFTSGTGTSSGDPTTLGSFGLVTTQTLIVAAPVITSHAANTGIAGLSLSSNGGNIAVNAALTGGTGVALSTTTGSITVDTGIVVSGGYLGLSALIGGDVVFVAQTDIINLGSVASINRDLSLTAQAGGITSAGTATLVAGRDATLLATGASGAMTIASLIAGNSATLTATGLISLGSVTATATDALITSNSGAITVSGTVSAGNDATLNALTTIGVGTVSAGHDATLIAGGDINYGVVTATQNASLTSSTGDVIGAAASSVTATAGTATIDATAGAFHLNAGATVSGAAVSLTGRKASTIDDGASVTATAGAATASVVSSAFSNRTLTLGNGVTFSATGGAVSLAGDGGLVIGTGLVSAATGAGSFTSALGSTSIGNGASVLVDGLLTVNGATGVTFLGGTLRGGTGFSSTASTGDIDVAANTILRATTGPLDLTATAGTLLLGAGATVEALSGSATLVGQAGVTGGAGLTVSGSTGVTLTATTGTMDLAGTTSVTSSGGAALVRALAGNVSLGAGSLVSGGSSATVSAGGSGTVTLNDLTQVLAGSGNAAVTAAGAANLTGGITIRSTLAQAALSGSSITHVGQLTIQAATGFNVSATAGSASFGGGTSFTTTGGLGSVSAGTSIALGAAPILTSTNGTLSVSAGTGITGGGGAQISGGAGVSLTTTTGDLDLVTAATIIAAAGPVTLTASAGSVLLGSGSSLTAGSGALAVSGASGITANALTATASAGNASFTASGGTIGLGSGSSITADAGTIGLDGATISFGTSNLIRSRDGTTLTGGAGGITGLASNQLRATNGAVSLTSATGAINFGNSTSFVAGNGALTFSGGTGVTLGTGLTATAAGGGVTSNAGSGSFSLGDGGTIGGSGTTTLSGAGISIGSNESITGGTGLAVTATTGNIVVGDTVSLSTTGGTAALAAASGTITLGATVTLNGGAVSLGAGSTIGIGSGFSSTASSGDFGLTTPGAVTIGTGAGITADSGQVGVSGGSVSLGSGSTVQARDLASLTGTAGDVTLADGIAFRSTAGAVAFAAGTHAVAMGNANTVTADAGTIGLDGATISLGTSNLIRSRDGTTLTGGAGGITGLASNQLRATNGAVSLTSATGAINFGNSTSFVAGNGALTFSGGTGVTLGTGLTATAAGGGVTSNAGSGSFSLGDGGTIGGSGTTSLSGAGISIGNNESITGGTGLSVTATTGNIVVGDTVSLSTTGGTAALAAASGTITLGATVTLNGGAVSLGAGSTIGIGSGFSSTASSGDFGLTTPGAVTIGTGAGITADSGQVGVSGGSVSLGSGSTVQARDLASLTGTAGDVTLGDGVRLTATAGLASINAGAAAISIGNGATVSGTAMTLAGSGGITIGTGFTGTASSGAATLIGGGIGIGTGASLTATGTLGLTGNAIGIGANGLLRGGGATSLTASSGTLAIGAGTTVLSTSGSVGLTATLADITLGAGATVASTSGTTLGSATGILGGNGVTVAASSGSTQLAGGSGAVSLGDAATIATTSGSITVTGASIGLGSTAQVTAGAAIGLAASGAISIGDAATVQAAAGTLGISGGSVTLGAGSVFAGTTGTSLTATTGALTIGDGGAVRSSLGNVTLAAAGNIASGTLVEALAGAASLTSSGGGILLNGSGTANSGSVKAATNVVLAAATGIALTGQAPANGSAFTSGIVQAVGGGISLATSAGNITQTGGLLAARGSGTLSFSVAAGSFLQAPDSGASIDALRLTGAARDGVELLAFSGGRSGAARGNRVENILALSSSAGAIRLQTVEAATSIGAVALTAPGAIQIWSERALSLTGASITSSGIAVASRIGTASAADFTGTRTSATVGDWAGLVSLYSGGAVTATNLTLNAEAAVLRAGVPMLFNAGFGAQPQTLMLDGVTASIGSAAVFAGPGGILAGGATVLSARGVGTSLPAAIFDSRVPIATSPRTALLEVALGEVRPDVAGTAPKQQLTKARNGILPGTFGLASSEPAGDIALNLQMVARTGQPLQNQGAAFLLVGAGNVSGTIDAGRLGVVGSGGSMSLLGTLNGQIGANAAQFGDISQVIPAQVLQRYRINGCVVTSINCVVPPAIQIVPPRTVDRANLTIEAGRLNTYEVIIPNVSDEDDDE